MRQVSLITELFTCVFTLVWKVMHTALGGVHNQRRSTRGQRGTERGAGLAGSTGAMQRCLYGGFLSWIFKNELVCVGRMRWARPLNQMEHVQRLKCTKLTHALGSSLVRQEDKVHMLERQHLRPSDPVGCIIYQEQFNLHSGGSLKGW